MLEALDAWRGRTQQVASTYAASNACQWASLCIALGRLLAAPLLHEVDIFAPAGALSDSEMLPSQALAIRTDPSCCAPLDLEVAKFRGSASDA